MEGMEVEVLVLVGGSGGGPLGISDGSHASSESDASLVSAGGPVLRSRRPRRKETQGETQETLDMDG